MASFGEQIQSNFRFQLINYYKQLNKQVSIHLYLFATQKYFFIFGGSDLIPK